LTRLKLYHAALFVFDSCHSELYNAVLQCSLLLFNLLFQVM